MKVVIVGGVAGGASAAARLRRLDELAEIVLFERGEYISFANCGLPYYVGGTISDKSTLTLQTPESFHRRFGIDVRVLQEVTAISPDDKTLCVRNLRTGACSTEGYDKLILSPGAKPILPNFVTSGQDRVFTLRNIPDTVRIREFIDAHHPQKALVVGGGAIGLELAENLVGAGLSVSLVEKASHLAANLDFDVACDLHHHARQKGLTLSLHCEVSDIRQTEDGSLSISVSGADGTRQTLQADLAVLSIGVAPESELAASAGLTCNSRKAIVVDRHMRTSCHDIYAVGDAVEVVHFVSGSKAYLPLAGPANRQGRIAADHICGLDSSYKGSQGSTVFKFFDMTFASTGLGEEQAVALGYDIEKAYLYTQSHAGYYPGATSMSIKVLADRRDGRILGAQIAGFDGVDKRCDILATVIRMKGTYRDLTELELCYAPPYGSAKDPVNMAGFVLQNALEEGGVRQIYWHDVDTLPRDGSATLLDVRTPAECQLGMIQGFVNIEVDELRQRLNELPLNNPIYVHCHSGLRSYLACRLLQGHGYRVTNIAGGYRLYKAVTEELYTE